MCPICPHAGSVLARELEPSRADPVWSIPLRRLVYTSVNGGRVQCPLPIALRCVKTTGQDGLENAGPTGPGSAATKLACGRRLASELPSGQAGGQFPVAAATPLADAPHPDAGRSAMGCCRRRRMPDQVHERDTSGTPEVHQHRRCPAGTERPSLARRARGCREPRYMSSAGCGFSGTEQRADGAGWVS
jgi:hypothetical protein